MEQQVKPAIPAKNSDWNDRYNRVDYFYGTQPNDFLAANGNLFKKGMKTLCIADGEGRNSVYVAQQGGDVTAVDFSSVALEKMQKLATQKSVRVKGICADLQTFDLGTNKWDFIVSIWCHLPSAIRHGLHQRVIKALKPGGMFLLESYTRKQIEMGTGGPKELDRLINEKILRAEIAPLKIIKIEELDREIHEGEGHNGLSAVIQLIAQKPIQP